MQKAILGSRDGEVWKAVHESDDRLTDGPAGITTVGDSMYVVR